MPLDPAVKDWVELVEHVLGIAVLLGGASLIRGIRRMVRESHLHTEEHDGLKVGGIKKLFERAD
jgi:hypothetical protein